METSFEYYWTYFNGLSPATSIVLNQDYEGIVTISVKLPGTDVYKLTGFDSPMQALGAMYNHLRCQKC